jgi:hypothetical protein
MTRTSSRQKRQRPNLKHGLYTLRTAVQTLGSRALPSKSTALGRALHEWRTALVADLGGADVVSVQQRNLVDLATTTKLMVDSIDAYVLTMGSLVNGIRRESVQRDAMEKVERYVRGLTEEAAAGTKRGAA